MRHGFDEPVECASTPGLAPQDILFNPNGSAMPRPTQRRLIMIENSAITPSPTPNGPALVVVAGRPGSGKGTQCTRILLISGSRTSHWVTHCVKRSTRRTPLGHEVRAFLEAGQLVPDRCVFELIGARLERHCSPVAFSDGVSSYL